MDLSAEKKKMQSSILVVTDLMAEFAESCPTLCDPMDCSPPGSSVHGILQARILEWVAISFSMGSSWLRDQIQVSCIGRQMLYYWATWEARGKPDVGLNPHFWAVWLWGALFHHPTCILTCEIGRKEMQVHNPSSKSLEGTRACSDFRDFTCGLGRCPGPSQGRWGCRACGLPVGAILRSGRLPGALLKRLEVSRAFWIIELRLRHWNLP